MPRTSPALTKGGFLPSESYSGPKLGRIVGTPADIYSKDPRKYASHFSVVKLNWTFHDSHRNTVADYRSNALELKNLGVTAVIKVSKLATHEHRLSGVLEWWPDLWEKYKQFMDVGVLSAVLWQCPPSLQCTDETLRSLETLCTQLLETQARHVFEFRHASWYERQAVYDILQRNGCCLAWMHLTESSASAWARFDGWSHKVQTTCFTYIQLHGTEGRARGRYPVHTLREIADSLPEQAIVLFCQVDVPNHAWSNAESMRSLIAERGRGAGLMQVEPIVEQIYEQEASKQLRIWRSIASGRVVRVKHLTAELVVRGRKCAMGLNHLRGSSEGFPKVGDILTHLRIEEDDWGELRVSSRTPDIGNTMDTEAESGTGARRWKSRAKKQAVAADTDALQSGLFDAGFTPCGDGIFVYAPRDITVELWRQCLWNTTVRARVAGRSEEEVATFIAPLVDEEPKRLGQRLLDWSKNVFEGADTLHDKGEASSEDCQESDDSATNMQDRNLSKCPEHFLIMPVDLGVDPKRKINLFSWGTSRLSKPPMAQLHITCSIKKLHYLTRNNKHIKRLNGQDEEVQAQVMRCGFFPGWVADIVRQIERDNVTSLALHCLKGTHRSVATAEILRRIYYPNATVEHLTLGYIRPGHAGGPSKR